jgi:hypothetical protein
MDKATKACRAPLKRGRKPNANANTVKSKSKSKPQSKSKSKPQSNKPCPEGQVLDKATKACRAPLKRGRTAKRAESPRLNQDNQDNTTLDKFGFVIPKYKPKAHNEPKPMKQTTLLAFSKKGVH